MNVCTICTREGLAGARAMVDSVRRTHRRTQAMVLVLDDRESELDSSLGPFRLVRPAELGIPRFEILAALHPPDELAEVVKPALFRLALDGFEQVLYLAPTTHVYGPLDELPGRAPATLVPRTRRPIPLDGLRPNDADVCRLGAHDRDIIALRRDRRVDEFLSAWSERLEQGPPSEHASLRAHWIDRVPALLGESCLAADPGIGLALWNTHERPLTQAQQGWEAAAQPLRLVNFRGFEPSDEANSWSELAHADTARPLPAELLELWRRHVEARDELREPGPPREYGWSRLADGARITTRLRRWIRTAEEQGRLTGSPFTPEGTRGLLDWLNEPAKEGGRAGVSRFWLDIYAERPDLQLIHPDLDGRGGEGFMAWIAVHGQGDYGVPSSLMPPGMRS